MAYWTHYWTNKTVLEREGREKPDKIGHTADNAFKRRGVLPGDVVYIVTVLKGSIHIIGRLIVDQVLDQRGAEAYFGEPVWLAEDHLIAENHCPNASTTFTCPLTGWIKSRSSPPTDPAR